jgi:hypothetical protein
VPHARINSNATSREMNHARWIGRCSSTSFGGAAVDGLVRGGKTVSNHPLRLLIIFACCWFFACIAKENPFTDPSSGQAPGADAYADAAGVDRPTELTSEAVSGGAQGAELGAGADSGAGGGGE